MATDNLSNTSIPSHVGLMMDGNRRWGKLHGKKNPITGTKAGVDALVRTVEESSKRGIKYITVYALSMENWNRSKTEVDYLLSLYRESVSKFVDRIIDEGVKVKFVGRIDMFPLDIQKTIHEAEERTKNNMKLVVNLAASYGGRAEIVDATKRIIKDGLKPEDVTEESFSNYIYEAGQPDPELIIRTGCVKRLSGFMLWQSAYSELYFTDLLWPDFDGKELDKALEYYRNVKRNFGK